MDKSFKAAFASLNRQQKRAVETIDGPLLVVAGPGTGKTQLLSTRVAYILRNTDTKPNNVLALTYTNKAAINMKQRIMELAGPEGARVPAQTFHSFAGEIMNLYPDHFWNAARLSIAPDSVQLDIIESIVSKLPLDNPLALKFAGQYTLLRDIQSAINLAKEAGLTAPKLQAMINFNLSYINKIESSLAKIFEDRLSYKKLPTFAAEVENLTKQELTADLYPLSSLSEIIRDSLDEAIATDGATGKTTNTSKWKARWLQTVNGQRGMINERERNKWWLELSKVYETYRTELHSRGFYDYADMLVEVNAQLEQNPNMLADIQERFSYVLVDEFQDTTPAQLRLAHLIADHYAAEGKPNLMVVGDDDQTIFRFNGAEVNNMLNFERQYPTLKKIVLTDNYRSSQAILDFSQQIIEQAETRLVNFDKSLNKDLRAVKPPKRISNIETLAFSSSELQYSRIGRDIKQHWSSSDATAVLARRHESLIKMANILQQLKVPVRYEQAANILDHQIIEQSYLIAKLLLAIQAGDKASTDALIHKIIRWPTWGLEPKELWRLAASNFNQPDWLNKLLSGQNQTLVALGKWFVWLAKQADNQPLAVTIEQILGLRESQNFRSPLRDYFQSSTKDLANEYFHGLSAIQLLRNLVHEFGKETQPTLLDMVRYIEINKNNRLVVADESPFITGERAVQLLTVHKAKGLEFDRVYIIDAIADDWRPRINRRKPPANLPLQPHGDDLDDYIRLMYVAATRARSSLTISGYHLDHAGREVALNPIIQSIKPFIEKSSQNRAELTEVLEENLRWPDLSAGDERAILASRLEGFNLNATHLIHFVDIVNYGPIYFKEKHLLKLPEARSPAQALGTAIHDALYKAQILSNASKFNLALVISEFEVSLTREQLPPAEHQRYLAKGKTILQNLFNKYDYKLPGGSLGEYKLRNISLGEAKLSGTLDRVEKTEQSLVVTDYKTGRPLSSFDSRDTKLQIKAYRHKLQLIFYALLLEAKDGQLASSATGQIVYVEADKAAKLTLGYNPNPEDIQRLKLLIEAVWRKIMKLDFPDTGHYPATLEGILEFEKKLIG